MLSKHRPPYRKVVMGGTFDSFHKGHERLLEEAFKAGETVLIGVTSDRLVRSMVKDHVVDPYRHRLQKLQSFLSSRGWLKRTIIFAIDDVYGRATIEKRIDAIIVSEETQKRVEEVNSLRRKRGFKPLATLTVKKVLADDGMPISSTRIRLGEIDSHGKVIAPEYF